MKVFHISWNDPETVFHEMPWKKNFTVYPSLKGDIYICKSRYVEDDFEFTSKLTYIIIYSNELGQKLHEYRHVQEPYVYLTNVKCDI